ncbi:subtilisin-like protein [Thozetella sp. PMI_491]|nr:subtilisin-like protein [Thozetella sp. PMI_491]
MRPEAIPNFCSLLGRKNSARVYLELGGFSLFEDEIVQRLHHDATPGGGIPLSRVLQEYHLSIPERIVLCHTIARSFWQFYDTKMMLAKWTSQNIWFMPSSGDPKSPSLPCRAYISFPFERAEYELEEYSTAGLIHRCPRIFALAVLLLEISLARPIETCRLQWDAEDFVGRTNVDHKRAMTQLQELRADSWTNYTGKHIYNFAIRECVVGTSFLPGGGSGSPQLAERRRIFYEKVVAPLQMVAGSYGREGMVEIKKKIIDLNTTNNSPRLFLQPTGTISASPDELIISKFPSFHTDRIANPEDWLEDLKTIGSYVHSIKTKSFPNAGVRPIRVAILDSGCNLDAPYFRDERESQRAGRIIEWKDFVDGSITKTDSFGHGTLMASLVIETSIVAELCLARVAENTEQLDGSEGRISDAIRWAGVHCEADIISMSFDVDDGEGSIKDAIRFVQNERNGRVIFFASAGNLGPHQDVAFPACHKDVIAIRATNYMGVVASSNPSTDPSAAVSLATFGDNIPLRLQESNPEVCKPGSSVATAVAAGIAATMLSYASMLPHIHPGHAKEDDLTRLRTVEGIEALFRLKLSQNMGNRINFVNPVRFFMENETNLLRLYAILDCLRKVR